MFQNHNEVQSNRESTREEQAIHTPEKKTFKPITPSIKGLPSNLGTNIPIVKEAIKSDPPNTETKQKKDAQVNS